MVGQKMQGLQKLSAKDNTMAMLLAMHCAPILKGSKIANLLTIAWEEFSEIGMSLQGTGISHCFLKANGNKAILYLYRKEELEGYIGRTEIDGFLKEYGYQEGTILEKLENLSGRISLYSRGEAEFPHEIGVFLGYPLMDVKGFIENKGENYVCCGYWKVYHDLPEASRLFLRYDREREQAIREAALGKSILEIAAK